MKLAGSPMIGITNPSQQSEQNSTAAVASPGVLGSNTQMEPDGRQGLSCGAAPTPMTATKSDANATMYFI
ncbi:hypothetical protein A7U60_g1150 [Sanghuangporus baumii]|uniref:Uncharacterized protein n=1 Tax=Sanghuangporus baumii TaxID=108892 RepID=A0A9Q5NEX0_SANBA|nr:hypothetical protein A7U60_g1150 [Sanghuangporus baumii]